MNSWPSSPQWSPNSERAAFDLSFSAFGLLISVCQYFSFQLLFLMILFGHPGGNPNSHHAALAHFEAGRLDAFCVPWMPSATTLKVLSAMPGWQGLAQRLARRRFEPLDHAPKIQGRLSEMRRLFVRSRGLGDEGLAYEANDWLMRTMKRECHRKSVTAVHSYEDCSLWQFEEAKRLGKGCIYDMPIGYYPAWEQKLAELAQKFSDWLPPGGLPSNRWVRPEQKKREMELADLVLAPSTFVRDTILQFHPNKRVALAPYGVDLEFWNTKAEILKAETLESDGANNSISDFQHFSVSAFRPLRFIYAGQCSIRKGIPVLLEAWRKAGLREATLTLVGSWHLAEARRADLPAGVNFIGPVSREALREQFFTADVFVCPTFFEGRTLAVGEALGCGLPVITTEASGMTDLVDDTCGRIVPAGNEEALIEALRWFVQKRDRLPALKSAARAKAETCTWANYRRCVSEAVANLKI
jgi:glycosyltransferase involved in cell wall biosynthesis